MNPLILQSDFGYADGAVSAMYGVAESVSPELRVFDLTHDIPQYFNLSEEIIKKRCNNIYDCNSSKSKY